MKNTYHGGIQPQGAELVSFSDSASETTVRTGTSGSPVVLEPMLWSYSLTFILDIGGEGRHPDAWNLNPRSTKTLGPDKGLPIPRHIVGRADSIPLPDRMVNLVIMERTPLTRGAIREIARVIAPGGKIVFRHAVVIKRDPHAQAKQSLTGRCHSRVVLLGRLVVQETEIAVPDIVMHEVMPSIE